MNIKMTTIPHLNQRYETVGDWVFNGDDLNITVSDMGNAKYEFLVSIHEMIEAVLCKDRGISEESVSAFDMKFESNRIQYQWPDYLEPGADPTAPYYKEHLVAEIIERLLAKELNIDWEKYSQAVAEL